MKMINDYKKAAKYVSKIWSAINERYYDNELQLPVTITIQPTVSKYGRCSCTPIWSNGVTESYEIKLDAECVGGPIENVVATLIHESCHLWAIQNGIKDISGYYHNKKFYDLASACGLDVQKHGRYGWSITNPTRETIVFCLDYGFMNIKLKRQPTVKGTSHRYRRYVCPCCGTIARTTKDVKLICGVCMKGMRREEK